MTLKTKEHKEFSFGLRQSGRTTRMLKHAMKLCDEGRAVYIIVDSLLTAERFRGLLEEPYRNVIKFETVKTAPNFDWDTLSLISAHGNCEILVDHYVIEDRFRNILSMLHAYDRGKG